MTMNEIESANCKYLDTCVKNLRKLKPVAFLDVATFFDSFLSSGFLYD